MKLFFLVLFLTVFGFSAHAQSARNGKDEQVFIEQLARIDSSAVPDFIAGTKAMDAGEFESSCNYYRAVLEKAPYFAPAMRRLGGNEVQRGNLEEGIELCERAYGLDSSWQSAVTLAGAYMQVPEGYANGGIYLARAMRLLEETRGSEGANDYEYSLYIAQASLRTNDLAAFSRDVVHMREAYPDSMATLYFSALLHANDEKWEEAESELLLAESKGLDPETVQALLDTGISSEMNFIRMKRRLLWSFAGWIIGLAALFVIGLILSAVTLRNVEKQIRNRAPLRTNNIRKVYRAVVSAAAVYYYLSLPLVLILLVTVVAGSVYLFFGIGRIPIYFLFLIVASGGISIFYMIKTLIVRPKVEDEGRVLREEEAPQLFALTREVANDLGTRPIGEIRIASETEMAVYERGSWRDKMQDRATRVLIVGAGVLKNFRVEEFRSVLAHEYGHFSNRDTAGGSMAFRVRNDIHRYAWSLALNGQARWWNLAYQFLRLYDFLFRRVSHGATRLQEILADRVAADVYGAKAFEGGLTHVIKSSVEFGVLASHEVKSARTARRGFSNLYELELHSADKIEAGFNKSMNRKTSNDDTHPAPYDRFRYIAGITGSRFRHSSQLVTELFADWNSITSEQTRLIEEGWKNVPLEA